jgi:hypothetical protein
MVASRDGGAGHVGWAAPAKTATRGGLPAWRFRQLFRGAELIHGKNFLLLIRRSCNSYQYHPYSYDFILRRVSVSRNKIM